jgi:competence protein ComGC
MPAPSLDMTLLFHKNDTRSMKQRPLHFSLSDHSWHHFNLVELLVVMALMSLLVSLLSPQLKKMVGDSYRLACGQQMKTLSELLILRSEDTDGQLVSNKKMEEHNYSVNKLYHNYYGWAEELDDYTSQPLTDIVYCPIDERNVAINKMVGNAEISYEMKKIFFKFAKKKQSMISFINFGTPHRQSLFMSRETFHSDQHTSSNEIYSGWISHNIIYADHHLKLDYEGYNDVRTRDAAGKVSWWDYPVTDDGTIATVTWTTNLDQVTTESYLSDHCEIDE